MVLPATYASGELPPDRALNIIYYIQLITLLLIIHYLIKKYKLLSSKKLNYLLLLFSLVVCFEHLKSMKMALRDTFTGKVLEISKNYSLRMEEVKKCKIKEICELEIISRRETITLFHDLSNKDRYKWGNKCMADALSIKQIKVVE